MSRQEAAAPVRRLHTSIYMILFLPFGISAGYVTVTLAYLLPHSGMTLVAFGALSSLTYWPQTLKVLWAPIIDTTLTSKLWYVIGAVIVGLTIAWASLYQTSLSAAPLLGVLVVVSSLASSLTSMATETFMAHLPTSEQGRASGWSQAGNVGGGSLGGGLGLLLAQHIHAQWVSGAVLCVICVASAVPLIWMPPPSRDHVKPSVSATAREVTIDVWSVIKSRTGLLVIFLMLLPLGSGGASNFWPSIAGDWRVDADMVALIVGFGTGAVQVVGSVIGGYICDVMDRKTAYCLFGASMAIVLVAMVYAPRTPMVFVVTTLIYGAILAMCYSAYSAVVLETIGKGAAATKFNLMSSVSNVPVAIMPIVDGNLHDKGGSNLMFFGEAGLSVAAALLFGLVLLITRRWRRAPVAV